MDSVDISSLFDDSRLPHGLSVVPVVLYFPIGVVLAVLRFFIGLHTFLVACILPKMTAIRSVVVRAMCAVLGIWVTKEGDENRNKNAKVLVSNYTSTLDHLAMDLVMPNVLPSVWDLPPVLMWLLGYTDMGAKQGRDALIFNAKKHCSESKLPLLVFPEGASTNGKTGLLKFSVWPFSLDQPVQPVIVKVKRPSMTQISPSVLGGRWWMDVLWFLFVPYTRFHIRILPSVEINDDESTEDFTKRVQKLMAKALKVTATPHTSADKVEYAKRKLIVQPAQASGDSSSASQPSTSLGITHDDSVIRTMVQQVKDVLPHVPIDSIRRDLALTKDVDLTITNILEGRVQYTCVDPGIEATPETRPPPQPQPKVASTSAESFGKTTKQRHLSLSERKDALLQYARRRYMEKHNML